MMSYLTALTMSLPCLYLQDRRSTFSALPFGGLNEKHILHLTMAVHILQILLSCDEFVSNGKGSMNALKSVTKIDVHIVAAS